MKTLEIRNYGVSEINATELSAINGGGLLVFAFLAGMAVAYYEVRIK